MVAATSIAIGRHTLKRLIFVVLIGLLFVIASTALAQSGGSYDLTWSTIDNGVDRAAVVVIRSAARSLSRRLAGHPSHLAWGMCGYVERRRLYAQWRLAHALTAGREVGRLSAGAARRLTTTSICR